MKCKNCGVTLDPEEEENEGQLCFSCYEEEQDHLMSPDELETDGAGHCFSDADPGL